MTPSLPESEHTPGKGEWMIVIDPETGEPLSWPPIFDLPSFDRSDEIRSYPRGEQSR